MGRWRGAAHRFDFEVGRADNLPLQNCDDVNFEPRQKTMDKRVADDPALQEDTAT